MKSIFDKLGLDETYTKRPRNIKYDSVKDNIPRKADLNFMADLLMLPTSKEGYRYLLVVVDLATDEFEIEPIKNKEPDTVLKAMKNMFKREHIKEPYYSIRTDGGTEFKGVFKKYLFDKSILHRVAEPYRHKQLSNVESLNRQLGRIFNLYMNKKEKETGDTYREWTDIIDMVRTELNTVRKKRERNPFREHHQPIDTKLLLKEPKFKVNDLVYRKSEVPLNALGKKQPTDKFRAGDYRYDLQARKITKVLYYPKNIRYLLTGLDHVSYTEDELLPAKEKEEQYEVEKIVSSIKRKGKVYYEIKWKKYTSSDNTYEPRDELIKTIPDLINDYENKKVKTIRITRPKNLD